ncbi:flagellar basal body-associated FliL family protein [Vibrio harveyi]|nr:flagellar basal body-associated FliL family protein [Vibrio harveyi]
MSESEGKKNKNWILIGSIVGAVVLFGGGGAYYWQQQSLRQVDVEASGNMAQMVTVNKPVFISVPKFVISLQGEHRLHYLMLEVSLMSYSDEMAQKVTEMMPLLRNSILKLVNERPYHEMSAPQAIKPLENEMLTVLQKQLNDTIGSKGIEKVLVTKMVLQ